jgi:hypothetical protein
MTQTLSRPRKIAIIGYDGVQSLEVTGPFEVSAIANRFGDRAAYDRTP